MGESRREELSRNLFEKPAAEGLGAIVAGYLYDAIALPYRLVTRRRRRARWRREEEAQAVKRAARRERRAHERESRE